MLIPSESGCEISDARKYSVTVHPYAVQYGEIFVPQKYKTNAEIEQYISDNFDSIEFGEPDLDYVGTDFEFEEDTGM